MPNPQPKTRLFDKSWGCRYIRDLYTKVDFKYLHVYVWNASPGCIIEEAFHFFFKPHPPPFLQSNNIVCHAEAECVMHRAPVFLRGMSYRSWDGVKQGATYKGGGSDGGPGCREWDSTSRLVETRREPSSLHGAAASGAGNEVLLVSFHRGWCNSATRGACRSNIEIALLKNWINI